MTDWVVLEEGFRAGVMRQLGTKRLFPWHRWYAVMDVSTPPECAALHDKVWPVDDPQLLLAAKEHFALRLHGCRCSGMTARSNEKSRKDER